MVSLKELQNELNTTLTLERDTTYNCIFSRTWETLVDNLRDDLPPQQMKQIDRIYFWEQESPLSYYEYTVANTYYKNGAAHLLLAGSHSLNQYEILVSAFSYN